jgi:hypothetical protein
VGGALVMKKEGQPDAKKLLSLEKALRKAAA